MNSVFLQIRTLLIIGVLMYPILSISQWTNELIDNDFDEPFKTSTTPKDDNCYLRLFEPKLADIIILKDTILIQKDTIIKTFFSPENPDGILDTIIKESIAGRKTLESTNLYSISFDLVGGHFCSDNMVIDIALVVNSEVKNYSFQGVKYRNNKGLTITEFKFTNVITPEFVSNDSDFIQDFKEATYIKLRINDTMCDTEYYEFSMKGSSSAIDFLTNIKVH